FSFQREEGWYTGFRDGVRKAHRSGDARDGESIHIAPGVRSGGKRKRCAVAAGFGGLLGLRREVLVSTDRIGDGPHRLSELPLQDGFGNLELLALSGEVERRENRVGMAVSANRHLSGHLADVVPAHELARLELRI